MFLVFSTIAFPYFVFVLDLLHFCNLNRFFLNYHLSVRNPQKVSMYPLQIIHAIHQKCRIYMKCEIHWLRTALWLWHEGMSKLPSQDFSYFLTSVPRIFTNIYGHQYLSIVETYIYRNNAGNTIIKSATNTTCWRHLY